MAACLSAHVLADLLDDLEVGREQEVQVCVLCSEGASGGADSRTHYEGMGLLNGFGLCVGPRTVEIAALEIERALSGPKGFDQPDPLFRHGVTVVVRELFVPEHGDLTGVPSSDDVQAEAATGDVIDGGALLRRQHRVNGRDVAGGEDEDVFRCLRQARRPGVGLETAVVEVGLASEALPSGHGDHRLDTRAVCGPGQLEALGPVDRDGPFGCRNRAAVAHVDSENPEFQRVVAQDGQAGGLVGHFYLVAAIS